MSSTSVSLAEQNKELGVSTRPVEKDIDASSQSKDEQPHTSSNTFVSAGLDDYYKPLESYEGYHRYDPEFVWEPKEEKKIVRKVSLSLAAVSPVSSDRSLRSISESVLGHV